MSDDPRALADELDRQKAEPDRMVLDYFDLEEAAAVLRAFAELPASTQALAHAAATVRARLGEGWEIRMEPISLLVQKPSCFVRFQPKADGSWMFVVSGGSERINIQPTFDDAITAALAVLGETE